MGENLLAAAGIPLHRLSDDSEEEGPMTIRALTRAPAYDTVQRAHPHGHWTAIAGDQHAIALRNDGAVLIAIIVRPATISCNL